MADDYKAAVVIDSQGNCLGLENNREGGGEIQDKKCPGQKRLDPVQDYKCLRVATKICATLVFTALYGMQTRSSDEYSVRPSVCLSVTRVHCDKTEERSVQIFTPYER